MSATPSGAGELANDLLTLLIQTKDFSIPDIDFTDPRFEQPALEGVLHDQIPKLSLDDLTTGEVNGTGAFDRLMTSMVHHLKVEYEANRISGAEYTKAYIGVIGHVLQTANQFLLTKDTAYWQALLVQMQARAAETQAVQARLELETARLALAKAQYDAATSEAQYALTKIKISTEDATYGNLVKQGEGLDFTNQYIMPAQKTGLDRTNANLLSEGVGIDYTNANILPRQGELLKEQMEATRAQTQDWRLDGQEVVGSIGKQKDLYAQQIISYQRDAETKAAKIFSDAWITQKTIDEGLLAPNQFTNNQIDSILVALRGNLNI